MPDALDTLRAALADRYAVEREVGRGGSAVVYLAHDLEHDRKVALKVLQPELALTARTGRFLREIQLAAQLSHPGILPVHDSAEAKGFLYYAMPFMQGESLRKRLRRERQLPMDQALRIACEVAEALSHAHGHGVVHRDIKPENILFEEGGQPVVADFGIARALTVASGQWVTETGVAVGTPAYMSPEQATANAELDGRSDVYSLGCVLYEMLAGHTPFTGGSAQEILARHSLDPVPSLRAARPAVPRGVEAAIAKALAKAPADRFASAREFAAALRRGAADEPSALRGGERRRRWPIVAAAAAPVPLLLVAAAYAFVPVGTRATVRTLLVRPDARLYPRRIVVAPLENRTGDSTFNVLGEMAADWMTRALTTYGGLQVVDSRTALLTAEVVERIPRLLRTRDLAIALARETGAGTVVSGSFYRTRDSLRADVQVVDVASQRLIRVLEPVAGHAGALAEFVTILGRRVTAALAASLDTAPAGAASVAALGEPPSYEAYRDISRAWESYFRRDTAEFFDRCARVLAADSTYVWAWIMYAQASSDFRNWQRLDLAVRNLRALRDRMSPGDRIALEVYDSELRGDLPAKAAAARELLRFFPGSADVPLLAAWSAVHDLNRPADALAALAQTDPQRGLNIAYPHYWRLRANAQHALREYALELESTDQGLRQFPTSWELIYRRLRALAALGRVEDVERDIRSCTTEGDPVFAPLCQLYAIKELRVHGHDSTARRLLARAIAESLVDSEDTLNVPWVALSYLYEAGLWAQARVLAERFQVRDSSSVDLRGFLGAVAARLGDRAGVEAADRWLAQPRRPFLMGRHTFWRAKIAAVVGDRERSVELLRLAFQQGQRREFRPAAQGSPDVHVHSDPDLTALRDYRPFLELTAARN